MNDILRRTYKQIDFNALENIEPKEIIEEKYLISKFYRT